MAAQVVLRELVIRPASLILAAAILLYGSGGLASVRAAEPAYHGVVVDADTKVPLEGAVVVVIWYRKPLVSMDGPQYFHRAAEVLTDAEGRFSVNASPGIDWNPFTYVVKEPRTVVFKPGYGPFPVAHVSPRSVSRFGQAHKLDLAELNAELLNGTVVELPKLKTEEEVRTFTKPGDMWFSFCVGASRFHCVPPERIPNFMRLINIQRKSANLDPFAGDLGGGQTR